MSKQIIGAIDGDKLLEWIAVEIDLSSGNNETEKADRWAFRHAQREIESGRLALPSDQSESTRLREALEEAELCYMGRARYASTEEVLQEILCVIRKALSSSHREDARADNRYMP